ncbi:protein phosphatase 2C [Nitzschia inconspicua]|uniref:Protein phosphatase 2C n=1 Tax=Nitzschia inconspicua TaxID=303405 RepID=A0A9K3KVF8_9STRA|nr:protein phosphatase 2C [Nitzschia inconspicua]
MSPPSTNLSEHENLSHPPSFPIAPTEGESGSTVVAAAAAPFSRKNTKVLSEESSSPPTAAALPLHSPSMTSSPRSAELASSEEESVAELGDVSEGECSSVEDYHDPETEQKRREQEDLEQGIIQDPMIDSSGGVVAVAQQVSIKECQAPPKCARFTEPDDDTESLIDHPIERPPTNLHQPQQSIGKSIDDSTATAVLDGEKKVLSAAPSFREHERRQASASAFGTPSIGTNSSMHANTPASKRIRMEDTAKRRKQASYDRNMQDDAVPSSTMHTPTSNSSMSRGSKATTINHPNGLDHAPTSLPTFKDPRTCMWTSSHAANAPSEDRSSSLVNVLLQPLPLNFDSETQLPSLESNDYHSLIRLNLWSVIDGHGGGCVATYASEVLLPHVAASIARALGCAIVSRGVCLVNGQLRDANALDLDGLIKTSDRSPANPNSIHYRSPYEASEDSDDEGDGEAADSSSNRRSLSVRDDEEAQNSGHGADQASIKDSHPPEIHSSMLPSRSTEAASSSLAPSGSSVKTSVKTAASVVARDAPVGTHSPNEVAAITRAITESFLAVDEGWINSIDPVATHQTSCQSNGRWNSGACALAVFTVQRLEWTSVSEEHRERELRGPAKSRGHDTSQNKDAARRRMLDNATRAKSASSLSTISSTSSLTTTDDRVNASGLESEITETEGEDDDHWSQDGGEKPRRRNPFRRPDMSSGIPKESLISPPGGCSCHCYRAYDALLYTAHVGDCRAVMLGSAPPRTIKVHGSTAAGHGNQTDDESSHHSSDETECLSSSDHDADSSDDEEIEPEQDQESAAAVTKSTSTSPAPSYMAYMRRPARRKSRRRRYDDLGMNAPFIALPPLEGFRSVEIEIDDLEYDRRRRHHHRNNSSSQSESTSSSSQDSQEFPPAIILPPVTRPIDLTTDHSAYNPAEVTAVLRRCNNAPRAISAGVGGGIKRVAGSLAVTRALGDAYLKTPRLSFFPYKPHAPYITARPEVNCRPIVKEGDKVLILATDGVWERASGEDVLRWVRTFYAERIAEAERRNSIDRLSKKDSPESSDDEYTSSGKKDDDSVDSQQAREIDQHQSSSSRNDTNGPTSTPSTPGDASGSRKRDVASSPSPPPASKRRKISGRSTTRRAAPFGSRRNSTVADVIVRRVLNKVRRARNISSLHALMSLPPGRARRSKHDDITACVVDLSAYVS